jgi:hypothetical protein
VPGQDLADRFGFGVREGQAEGLGDLSFGVGDDDACLFFDRREPFRIVTSSGGAVAQQPEQRIGNGGLAGAVAADEPAHHREVIGNRRPGTITADPLPSRATWFPSGRWASAQKITDR